MWRFKGWKGNENPWEICMIRNSDRLTVWQFGSSPEGATSLNAEKSPLWFEKKLLLIKQAGSLWKDALIDFL